MIFVVKIVSNQVSEENPKLYPCIIYCCSVAKEQHQMIWGRSQREHLSSEHILKEDMQETVYKALG